MFYSQFGEDKILFEIFQRKTSGFCVNDWYAHQTINRLVNIRSKIRIMWLALKIKAESRLRRIPLIVKIRNLLRAQGVR